MSFQYPQSPRIRLTQLQGHDASLPEHLSLLDATHTPTAAHPHLARTRFLLTIPATLCNMSGSLHGGAVALIFDICTSVTISICARRGFWDAGHVSRTLNCTYLRPAAAGMKVVVESEVVHLGRRMGVVTGIIRGATVEEGGEDDGSAGKVFYTCEHGKACLEGSSRM
jgi:uncharacterized protein (TIGR00369 family)